MPSYPVLELKQYTIGTDPTGYRHQDSGHGLVRFLNTAAGGTLIFNSLNTTTSGAISETVPVIVRVDDYGDASGIYNMKFYLASISSWTTGTYRFLQRISTSFLTDLQLSEADNDTPTILSNATNILPANGYHALSGVNDDDTSQYIYISILAKEDVPVKTYGGAGVNGWRYRLFYDFS